MLGCIVFGAVRLVDAILRSGRSGSGLVLVSVVLSVAGLALLQGGLVEIVRGLHTDGDDDPSLPEILGRAAGRTLKLVRVSVLAGLGIGVGLVFLLVPGLVLATRWAVAVPVGMLEDGSARHSLRRSGEIVTGNGWAVFRVLVGVGLLQMLVTVPFTVAAAGAGPFGWWVGATLGSALSAPYAAHALTVVYYGLVEPERPVALESGQRWQSIWDEQDPGTPESRTQPGGSVWGDE